MSKHNRGLVAAMEDESVIPELDNTEVINFEAAKKKETEDDIKVCEGSVKALESILVTLDNSIKTGGLDPIGSKIMYRSLEDIYKHAKVDSSGTIPALEAFHAPAVRIGSTRDAMETIKSKIGLIQERITSLKNRL